MIRSLLFLLLTTCFLHAKSQQKTISGRLIDQQTQKAIAYASITVKNAENKVIAFKSTDPDGRFLIQTVADIQHCSLEINHLGYERYSLDLAAKSQDLNIPLVQKKILLEDIKVKSRPQVQRIGDTIAYNVGSFAKEEDRNIGDVIKRMPGMEVSESGQIKYQGKAISNFYIDGDDLLDDRYAIGTRTIPHKMVQDIQVLNNHEHLKVLKNKRFTDQVAINLVIKDDAKLKMTGEAKIGLGIPKQYDNELNNILFNKKYKMLNVLSANNIGKNLRGDLLGYNRESTLNRLGTSAINNLLSLGTVGDPPVAQQYYLMNNTLSLNTNNLFNLKKDWQVKANVQGLFDKNHKTYRGTTEYQTPTETITFNEEQYSQLKSWLAAIRLTASRNLSSKFISNYFALEYEKERATADLNSNGNSILADQKTRLAGINNQLEYVPALKNGNIMQFSWNLNYGEKPQTLQLAPGIFPNILNEDKAYLATNQHLNVPNLFTRISTGYRFPKGKINQYYQAGISLEDQNMQSHIRLDQLTGSFLPTLDSTVNDLHWLRTVYSLSAAYSWKKQKLETELSLPLTFQNTRYKDLNYQLDEAQQRLLFGPSFKLKYPVAQQDDLDFVYNFSNDFGNIQDIYRGLVIRSYRSLSKNSININESSAHNLAFNYRFNRTLKLLFANLGASYSQTTRNAMIGQEISNEVSQSVLLPLKNKINKLSINAGIDKYVFALSSSIKLKAQWSYTDYNQLFNGELLPFQNSSFSLQPETEFKIWKNLKFSYNGVASWTTAKQKDNAGLTNRIFSLSQNIGIPFYAFKNTYIRISGRQLYNQQPGQATINYVFIDAFARYRHSKWKTDFELNMSNLANLKNFNTYSIAANQQSQNNYELRGRMIVLKTIFSL